MVAPGRRSVRAPSLVAPPIRAHLARILRIPEIA
jgi:hypothetical protein